MTGRSGDIDASLYSMRAINGLLPQKRENPGIRNGSRDQNNHTKPVFAGVNSLGGRMDRPDRGIGRGARR